MFRLVSVSGSCLGDVLGRFGVFGCVWVRLQQVFSQVLLWLNIYETLHIPLHRFIVTDNFLRIS